MSSEVKAKNLNRENLNVDRIVMVWYVNSYSLILSYIELCSFNKKWLEHVGPTVRVWKVDDASTIRWLTLNSSVILNQNHEDKIKTSLADTHFHRIQALPHPISNFIKLKFYCMCSLLFKLNFRKCSHFIPWITGNLTAEMRWAISMQNVSVELNRQKQ